MENKKIVGEYLENGAKKAEAFGWVIEGKLYIDNILFEDDESFKKLVEQLQEEFTCITTFLINAILIELGFRNTMDDSHEKTWRR